ncbi:MAG: hypothetical protein DRJ60_05485 [Thermoprotei archaeon]|nr:MAG: hypothetical protein DRJ60_05485 [Thermoprotei archaeon]
MLTVLCSHCGKSIVEDAICCPYCGFKLKVAKVMKIF